MTDESKFSLDQHIQVWDMTAEVYIEVCPDPDGLGMISLQTFNHPQSKEFYGSLELTFDVGQAKHLCTAIENTCTHIKDELSRVGNSQFNMVPQWRVYDDNDCVYLLVSPDHLDNTSVVISSMSDEKSKEWYGPVDFSLPSGQAKLLVTAIRLLIPSPNMNLDDMMMAFRTGKEFTE